jgi:stage II sporulation protein D
LSTSWLRRGVPAGAALVLLGAGSLALRSFFPGSSRAREAAPSLPVAAASDLAIPGDGRLRIGLRRLSGRPFLVVKMTSAGRIADGVTGETFRTVRAGMPLKILADYGSGQVLIKGPGIWVQRPDLSIAGGLVQIGRSRYPGKVRFRLAGTGLQLTNDLDIEQYLEGVLPGEIPAYFGMEAQKALAVAARTYALVQRGKHGDYDLCDRTCCQMYLGYHRGSARGLKAVRATRRLCLWSGPELAYTFYSADCGGVSTSVDDVPLRDKPQRPLPYLQVVRDAAAGGANYCRESRYQQWVRRIPLPELERRLNADPETRVGRLRDLRVAEYDPSGRVKTVVLRGAATAEIASAGVPPLPSGEKTVTGWALRRAVGPMALKSTRMTIDRPQPGVVRFVGSGFGHGLGLCQIGANGMARHGFSFRQILAHYYPGTRASKLPR